MATLTTDSASVVYDVHDMKVYPLSTDVIGASPTYGTGVDVPGVAEVSVEPNLVTAELKGDARIIAKKGRTDRVNFSATWGKHSLALMKQIMGGLTGAAGTTPSTKAAYRLASPAPLPYFRLDFKIDDLDTGFGDLWVILYKCQITGGSLVDTSSDNFSQPSMDGEGIAIEGNLPKLAGGGNDDGVMVDFIYRETAAALTTTAGITSPL